MREGQARRGRFLLGVIGGLVGLAVVALALLAVSYVCLLLGYCRFEVEYDEGHRDYEQFAREFERIQKLDLVSSAASDWSIDFSQLASGNWQTACLLGGFIDPLKTAEEFGWGTAEADRDRLKARLGGLRASIVEEFEVLVAYTDQLNNAEFIHFRHGIGAAGQHLRACISKPETRLVLDAVRREWAGQ